MVAEGRQAAGRESEKLLEQIKNILARGAVPSRKEENKYVKKKGDLLQNHTRERLEVLSPRSDVDVATLHQKIAQL